MNLAERSDPGSAVAVPGRPGSPVVMGIVNVTPDSFSDGGAHATREAALDHALALAEAGAAIVDVGGESTRPGASPVPLEVELERVVPVVEALCARSPVLVSVDTSKPGVMRAAVAAGARMVNDVRALRADGALATAAGLGVAVCLVHMRGEPGTMQDDPRYDDVVAEVRGFLLERARACEVAGIARGRIVVDPGFGFGKTVEHNLALLAHLDRIADAGYPVLVGLSRKATLRALTGRTVERRLAGSLALAIEAARRGASIVRAHDVEETVDALAVAARVERAAREEGRT